MVVEKTLKSPLDCKIKPVNLKEINPEYSLEGLMLRLKLQYFGHLMQRAGSLEKTLMVGKIEGRRRRGQQRTRWLDGIIFSMDMSLSKLSEVGEEQGSLACYSPWCCKESDLTEWVNNKQQEEISLINNSGAFSEVDCSSEFQILCKKAWWSSVLLLADFLNCTNQNTNKSD